MLLEIGDLSVRYATRRGRLTAVDQVSLQLERGETLGLVGESGCGKSSLGKAIVRLVRADAGEVLLDGEDVLGLDGTQMKKARKRLQMVFQDPLSALDPRLPVRRTLTLPFEIHGIGSRQDRHERVDALLQRVGLSPELAGRMPHELSGGQRQRVNIARALSVSPDIVICDEPISALDVSLQAQILNLLSDLRDEQGLSYLFISHDLAAVEHLASRIAVMYLGRIVELIPRERLWRQGAHPYTRLLTASIPSRASRRVPVPAADLPSPFDLPAGCAFQGRCPHAMPVCRTVVPPLGALDAEHSVACHLYSHEQIEQPEATLI